jgi:hypothetical protein
MRISSGSGDSLGRSVASAIIGLAGACRPPGHGAVGLWIRRGLGPAAGALG